MLGLLAFICGSIAPMDMSPESLGEFGALQASKEWTPPTDPAVLKELKHWQDQKVGILIHWGTYSQWGIVESWSLVTTRYPWAVRPAPYDKLTDVEYRDTYEKLAQTFNPTKFDADKWAKAFKDAGIRYVLSMTKHHDGFCMWDTKETDYRITGAVCPFHSDPRADTVKVMSEAFRRHGLISGLYFSKADWHSPYYWLPELGPGPDQGPNYVPATHPESWRKFKDFTWKQIEELMTGYGKQEILWLDGGAVRPPDADIDMDGMAAMARKHQPGLLVVDRTVAGRNENYVTPEGEIPDHHLPYPWETCMPMGTSWTWKPHDNFKSVGTLVRHLCQIVARGGNYLIGVGPDAHGEFDPGVYERLHGLGAWLKTNGEAIYSTRTIAPYEQGSVVFTQKPNGDVCAIVLSQEDGDSLPASVQLPAEIASKFHHAEVLGLGPVSLDSSGVIAFRDGLRAKSAGGLAWAIKLSK